MGVIEFGLDTTFCEFWVFDWGFDWAIIDEVELNELVLVTVIWFDDVYTTGSALACTGIAAIEFGLVLTGLFCEDFSFIWF